MEKEDLKPVSEDSKTANDRIWIFLNPAKIGYNCRAIEGLLRYGGIGASLYVTYKINTNIDSKSCALDLKPSASHSTQKHNHEILWHSLMAQH